MGAPSFLRRACAVWLVIAVVETLHGTLRELWLAPVVGGFAARQLAVGTGSLLVLAIALVFSSWIGAPGRRSRLAVGLLWVVLTLAFELGLGVALGYSAARLASDYDLRHGGLMPIGLLAMMLAPLIVHEVRQWHAAGAGGRRRDPSGGRSTAAGERVVI